MGGYRTNSGDNLKKLWKIPAQQVRYHKDGTFFMPLDRFPAALCDPSGYILFNSQKEYETNRNIEIGSRINVRCGISKLPGYKSMIDEMKL